MSFIGDILELLGLAAPVRMSQTTSYAGMDVGSFPGNDIMSYFHNATNLAWSGAYMDSPAPFPGQAPPSAVHSGQVQGHNMLGGTLDPSGKLIAVGSWMAGAGQASLAGFGILPIYWGQQDDTNNQGPWDLRTVAGQQNGIDAIAKIWAMNLSPHAVIYLDYENSHLGTDGIAYCTSWFATIASAGYRPGLYAHGPTAVKMRQSWPDLFVWVTNPYKSATDTFVVPRVGPRVQVQLIDPGLNVGSTRDGYKGADRDAVAWQMWFSSSFPWPAALTLPLPPSPLTLPLKLPGGTPGIDATGHLAFGLDVSSSSVANPAFPERACAPGLVRRGRFSAAVVDASTLGMFAIRRGALVAATWTVASSGTGTLVALPDEVLAFNPWSPHSALARGTSGDLAIVARSALVGTADNDWRLHAYRRRGTTWTFDSNINGARPIEPLLGVKLVSRKPDTVEAFFVTNDGSGRVFVVASIDAATQADGQPWSAPVVVNAPAGLQPSLVSSIGAVSRAALTVDVFIIATAGPTQPWQLFWNSSSKVGTWPTFSVPGADTVALHPFSNVASISRGLSLVDVFAIAKGPADPDWSLYWWWWNSTDAWGIAPNFHTRRIAGTVVSPHAVGRIAAVSRSQQFIDVFIVGSADGLLYQTSWDSTTGVWSDFQRVGTNNVLVSSVDGAFSRAPDAVDVVVTGRDGNVYVTWWNSSMAIYHDLVRTTMFDLH
jgi:hypothetical protein